MMTAGCCLFAALLFARPSVAAPRAAPDPRTVSLHVDVDELGDKAIGLDKKILEHIGPPIDEADFQIVGDDSDAAMVLRVRLRVLQSGEYDYGVHIEFVHGDSREPVIEWVECRTCVDARLFPVLDEQLPALLLALEDRAKELTVEPTGDGDGGEPDPGEVAMPKPTTGLGIGGAIVGGLGIGALIGGGVELSRGLVIDETTTTEDRRIDHRPPGYALIAVGATALVAGAVMLGVDLAAQSKKRKARAQAERAQVFPILTPESVGLGIVGRF
jgi:hypothetical protein